MHPSLYSSARADWATPPELFAALDAEFGFTLDPCCTPETAKCPTYFTEAEDGLKQDWQRHRVFMNSPYGRVLPCWMQKAWDASKLGALVVALVAARTDTAWWHDIVIASGAEVRFLRGRLKFGCGKGAAPFPSAVVIFRPPWVLSVAACMPLPIASALAAAD